MTYKEKSEAFLKNCGAGKNLKDCIHQKENFNGSAPWYFSCTIPRPKFEKERKNLASFSSTILFIFIFRSWIIKQGLYENLFCVKQFRIREYMIIQRQWNRFIDFQICCPSSPLKDGTTCHSFSASLLSVRWISAPPPNSANLLTYKRTT